MIALLNELDPIVKFSLCMVGGGIIYFALITLGEWIADKPNREAPPIRACEMQGCERIATHYAGYAGADQWAGRVCGQHSEKLAWREPLR